MERKPNVVIPIRRSKKAARSLTLEKPQRDEPRAGTPAADPGKQRRLVAEVPERIHREVRQRCLNRDIEIREYLLELLAKDGIE